MHNSLPCHDKCKYVLYKYTNFNLLHYTKSCETFYFTRMNKLQSLPKQQYKTEQNKKITSYV